MRLDATATDPNESPAPLPSGNQPVWYRDNTGLGFTLMLVILAAIAIASYRSTTQSLRRSQAVEDTLAVITSLESLHSITADAEGAGRGYILTGRNEYLPPFAAAARRADRAQRDLRRWTADDPTQRQRLDALEPLVRARLATLRESMDVRRAQGLSAAVETLLTDRGRLLMNQVRSAIDEMVAHESTRLEQRGAVARASAQTTQIVIVIGSLLAFAVAAGARIIVRRERAVRDRAQAARNQTEARLQAIIDNSPAVIYLKDAAGRHILHNDRFAHLFGLTRSQIIGRTDDELFPAATARAFGENDRRVLESGTEIIVEETAQHDDGPHTYVSVKFPLRGDDGVPYAVCGISTDITARRHTELELRQRSEDLEVSNQELEAFSYSVSHDLRAPLRHMNGFVKLLRERAGDQLDPPALRYVDLIAAAADKMGHLIDDLLAFSRTGRTALKIAPVALDDLVAQARRELAPAIGQRHIAFDVGPLPLVQGDRTLLQLVVVNLLSNAIKYTAPRAEAHIEVLAARNGNGEVVVSVRDNGVGFDARYSDKLFRVFQRLHRDDEFEGTGIGLATVRRIVQRHGGTVWAESTMDHGATFSFSLKAV